MLAKYFRKQRKAILLSDYLLNTTKSEYVLSGSMKQSFLKTLQTLSYS